MAGIILPRSILSNPGIYEHARKMIFEHFHLVGIVVLGSNAFSVTGINTVILFLKKRIKRQAINNSEDFMELCKQESDVVLLKNLSGEEEKRFLGYQFSTRKGNEGIKRRDDSLLEYAHTHILEAMVGEPFSPVRKELEPHIRIAPLESLIDWEDNNPIRPIKTDDFCLFHPNAEYLVVMEDCIATLQSGSRPKGGVSEFTNGVPSLGGEHVDQTNETITQRKIKYVSEDFFRTMKKGQVRFNDILLCKDGAHTGKLVLFEEKQGRFCVNEHLFIVRANEKCDQWYMFYFMMSSFFQSQVRALAYNKKGQLGLNKGHFKKIKFLQLPKEKQKRLSAKSMSCGAV